MLKGIKIKRNNEINESENTQPNNKNSNNNNNTNNSNLNRESEKNFMHKFLGYKEKELPVSNNSNKIENIKKNKNDLMTLDLDFNFDLEIRKTIEFLFNDDQTKYDENCTNFKESFEKLEANKNNISNLKNIDFIQLKTILLEIDDLYVKNDISINEKNVDLNLKEDNNLEYEQHSQLNINKNKYDYDYNKTNIENKEKENFRNKSKVIKCLNCSISNNLIVSEYKDFYISYPIENNSLTDFHIIISTFDHYQSSVCLSENQYLDLRYLMKQITHIINTKLDKSIVFIEQNICNVKDRHFLIECIPVDKLDISEIKLCYKKAFDDKETMNSINKNIIETYIHKGNLKSYINNKFYYFNVDFDGDGGFLHLIEDENRFSSYNNLFLKEVLGNFLQLSYFEIKNPIKKEPNEIQKIVDEYKKLIKDIS